MNSVSKTINIKIIEGSNLNNDNIGQYLPRDEQSFEKIKDIVLAIINNVKENGDKAINEYSEKFDKVELSTYSIRVTDEDIENAFNLTDMGITEDLIKAIKQAKENIEQFHKAQIREDWFIEKNAGIKTGQIMRPIERVGLMIPGGVAVYPSSVLMTAVPAKIAGVKELVVCSPPQKDGKISPGILVACKICGVDEIYCVGGAQAVAALAYGTKTIPPVQKIMGPGSQWVNSAKQLVANKCAIDNPAGPSDILLLADDTYPSKWSAYDLLAQSEHGEGNVSVLVSENVKVIESILKDLNDVVEASPRKEIIKDNLEKNGLIIKTNSLEESIKMINLVAPEHLQLNIKDGRSLLKDINNAGAIFIGGYSPVPLGDYCAGTNHVLPTAGYAKTYSGLSTFDYLKVMDVLEVSKEGLKNLLPTLKPLTDYEGLMGHYDCAAERVKKE